MELVIYFYAYDKKQDKTIHGIKPNPGLARKTIQNTPVQQQYIFSNTDMLVSGICFFQYMIFLILRIHFLRSLNINNIIDILCFLYFNYCIYRNVIPHNLNWLLRMEVAKWTFAVWFHAPAWR